MGVDRGYVARNDTARARLKALVAGMSDAQLGHAMPAGWTVAAVLAHLAFWDQRIVVLIDAWESAGAASVPRAASDADVDWINDAGKPQCLVLQPRVAAQLAVAAAEAADGKLAGLKDEFVAANAKAGSPINPLRATHRKEHLDEIERALKP